MLYLLTGNVQTGKTRWLQGLVSALEGEGVGVYGMLAPGRWIEHRSDDGLVTYEKMGIDNELLPQHETIPFARRASDLSEDEARNSCSQAQSAKLSWAIDDSALERVNEHLDWISRTTADSGSATEARRGLLVIDELGRLEILHGKGLTNGLALVERGATVTVPNALVIVREQLLDQAQERFASAPWGGMEAIFPTPETRDRLLARMCRFLGGNDTFGGPVSLP